MILVAGATGMFGGGVVRDLLRRGAPVRALVRNPDKASGLREAGAELAVADMDDPTTLDAAFDGAERFFLVSPMDDRVADRELAMIEAAERAAVEHVVKLFGAVEHDDDPLVTLHKTSIARLRESGLGWSLLSPNTVMESNLFPFAELVHEQNAIVLPAGDAEIGMVAADDCTRAAGALLTGSPEIGRDYQITGPTTVTFAQIAEILSRLLGREIVYRDMPEDEFRELLIHEVGVPEDQVEIGILCHYRAFRAGGAELITDTYRELTGEQPTAVEQFLQANLDRFRS
jgi:uncharacterized protein YbjT (DUF2867 family)